MTKSAGGQLGELLLSGSLQKKRETFIEEDRERTIGRLRWVNWGIRFAQRGLSNPAEGYQRDTGIPQESQHVLYQISKYEI